MHSFLLYLQLSLGGAGVGVMLSKQNHVMRQQIWGKQIGEQCRVTLESHIFGPLLLIILFKSEDRAAVRTVHFALFQSILWHSSHFGHFKKFTISGCHFLGLILLVFWIVDMGFFGLCGFLCFYFVFLLDFSKLIFSYWVVVVVVVGTSRDGWWVTPIIQVTEVQRVSKSLRVAPVLSG